MGVQKERIRQIEAKALRRLKHPAKAEKLIAARIPGVWKL
jgi:DNA-directed RNA polymerase sigma subunit (sigma70/sigma32)